MVAKKTVVEVEPPEEIPPEKDLQILDVDTLILPNSQRELETRHVDFLYGMMQQKGINTAVNAVSVNVVNENGVDKYYLLDGQHRIAAARKIESFDKKWHCSIHRNLDLATQFKKVQQLNNDEQTNLANTLGFKMIRLREIVSKEPVKYALNKELMGLMIGESDKGSDKGNDQASHFRRISLFPVGSDFAHPGLTVPRAEFPGKEAFVFKKGNALLVKGQKVFHGRFKPLTKEETDMISAAWLKLMAKTTVFNRGRGLGLTRDILRDFCVNAPKIYSVKDVEKLILEYCEHADKDGGVADIINSIKTITKYAGFLYSIVEFFKTQVEEKYEIPRDEQFQFLHQFDDIADFKLLPAHLSFIELDMVINSVKGLKKDLFPALVTSKQSQHVEKEKQNIERIFLKPEEAVEEEVVQEHYFSKSFTTKNVTIKLEFFKSCVFKYASQNAGKINAAFVLMDIPYFTTNQSNDSPQFVFPDTHQQEQGNNHNQTLCELVMKAFTDLAAADAFGLIFCSFKQANILMELAADDRLNFGSQILFFNKGQVRGNFDRATNQLPKNVVETAVIIKRSATTQWADFKPFRPDGQTNLENIFNPGTDFVTWPQPTNQYPFRKPADLMAKFLQAYSRPNDTIVEAFSGSLSLLYGAMKYLRKHVIFIEKDAAVYNTYQKLYSRQLENQDDLNVHTGRFDANHKRIVTESSKVELHEDEAEEGEEEEEETTESYVSSEGDNEVEGTVSGKRGARAENDKGRKRSKVGMRQEMTKEQHQRALEETKQQILKDRLDRERKYQSSSGSSSKNPTQERKPAAGNPDPAQKKGSNPGEPLQDEAIRKKGLQKLSERRRVSIQRDDSSPENEEDPYTQAKSPGPSSIGASAMRPSNRIIGPEVPPAMQKLRDAEAAAKAKENLEDQSKQRPKRSGEGGGSLVAKALSMQKKK